MKIYNIYQSGKRLYIDEKENPDNKIVVNKYDNMQQTLRLISDGTLPPRLYWALRNPKLSNKYFILKLANNEDLIVGTDISAYAGLWDMLLIGTDEDYIIEGADIDQSRLTYVSDHFGRLFVRDNFLEELDFEEQTSPTFKVFYDEILFELNKKADIKDIPTKVSELENDEGFVSDLKYESEGKNSFRTNEDVVAIGDNSFVTGTNNIAGCKGYYIQSIDLTNKKIYLSSTQQVPVISTKDNKVSVFVTPQYSVGDYFCVINNNHYIYKATIKSIVNNVVTYDGDLGFTSISGTAKDPHDFSFYVPTKPTVGVASLITDAFAFGLNCVSAGRGGIAGGNGCVVAASSGVALGSQCVAGYIAFAFGFGNKSLGTRSASFGSNNESLGNNSFTTGENNIASGVRSYSEGYKNQSQGENAHSEGYNTKAIGGSSHTEGHTTEAKYCAHAEGHTTKAHGNYSHAEGQNTQALGGASHTEGANTIASGWAAHAEGAATQALGIDSHAEGVGTIAKTHYQHVQGKYNAEDTKSKYAHIVGWGSSDTDRKNIHTLDTDGNAWYEGDVVGNGISLATVNSNANTAKTNASSALTKATNAESTADTANTKASNAETVANTAQTTANNANTKASNAEKKVTALEEYSGIIDIPYFDKIQPTDKAIYRVPHNYLALDGKFYDYAAVHTVEDYKQFTISATQMIKDSQGNDKVQYSICYDVNQKQYYCYYNNIHCILDSDTVRSQVFNGRTYVGAVTNPEDAQEGTYGVFKVYTLYMYVENVGYVRLNTDKTKGYFAERFNSPDNKPTGSFSTSLGIRTKALGYAALAGGDSSKANGAESIAIGAACVANKYASSATCNHTIANGKGQSARGEYNEPLGDGYLEVVGNGTSIGNRSNAYTLDKEGNAWFAGNVYVGDGKKILITEEDYPTQEKGGVVKVYHGNGVSCVDGQLAIVCATEQNIDERKQMSKPITPSNLDYAVRSALAYPKVAWGEEAQALALETLEAIKNPKPANNSLLAFKQGGKGEVEALGYTNYYPYAHQFCKLADESMGDEIQGTGYTLANTPTRPYHTANKKYVDDLFKSITDFEEVAF